VYRACVGMRILIPGVDELTRVTAPPDWRALGACKGSRWSAPVRVACSGHLSDGQRRAIPAGLPNAERWQRMLRLGGWGGVICLGGSGRPRLACRTGPASVGLGGPFPCCSAPMSKKRVGQPLLRGASWLVPPMALGSALHRSVSCQGRPSGRRLRRCNWPPGCAWAEV